MPPSPTCQYCRNWEGDANSYAAGCKVGAMARPQYDTPACGEYVSRFSANNVTIQIHSQPAEVDAAALTDRIRKAMIESEGSASRMAADALEQLADAGRAGAIAGRALREGYEAAQQLPEPGQVYDIGEGFAAGIKPYRWTGIDPATPDSEQTVVTGFLKLPGSDEMRVGVYDRIAGHVARLGDVPREGYADQLHPNESILTREQADRYRDIQPAETDAEIVWEAHPGQMQRGYIRMYEPHVPGTRETVSDEQGVFMVNGVRIGGFEMTAAEAARISAELGKLAEDSE